MRISDWSSDVCSSDLRQETARALLTPGEVMQLAPTDELILVSGQPPIRAKKLRYFEDEAFTARVLPAPALGDTAYPDLPPSRPDKLAGQIRGVDVRLDPRVGNDSDPEAGGLEQAPHPAHAHQPPPADGPALIHPFCLARAHSEATAWRPPIAPPAK